MNSGGGGRPLPPILSQQVGEAGGSLTRVVTVRVASGPDKVGTCQHCQMVRVRRARWKGVRKEPAFTSLKGWIGSNLADMGRERCVPTHFGLGTLGSASTTGRETTVKCCGVAVVMPQGPSRAPPSSSEITANTGTVLVLPPPAHPAQKDRLGAPTVDRSRTGRSRRSTSSRGKPGTWGRAAAVIEKGRTL